ncbi:MAG: tetratricopeptide repeat protein [Pirellulaceae bacterium]|nr:tetratricopeptide repeat protein [Planctomycetales bacterium]
MSRRCNLPSVRICLFVSAVFVAGLYPASVDTAHAQKTKEAPKRVIAQPKIAKPARDHSQEERPEEDIYESLVHGTVYLDVTEGEGAGWSGTGWLLNKEKRLVVTNDHVASSKSGHELQQIFAWFPVVNEGEAIHDIDYYIQNEEKIFGKVLFTDSTRDLAVLQLDSIPDKAVAFELAERSARPGEPLHSLAGLPQGSEGLFIYTLGTSRAVYKRSLANGANVKVLEAQMPINRGNSGGPIINAHAQIVGVCEGFTNATAANMVTMSVDVSEVRDFLSEIEDYVDPETAEQFIHRGDLHYDAGRYKSAMTDFNRAIELDPKNAEAVSDRGWVFYKDGDYDTAMADFKEALALDNQFLDAYYGQAAVHRARGEVEEAIKAYTQAIRISHDDHQLADLYNSRGNTYYEAGEYDKAVADYDRSIAKDDTDAIVFGNKGDALTQAGKYDEACSVLDKAIEMDGTNAEFWNVAGNNWYARDNYPNAVEMYNKAIEIDPDEQMYYRNRGNAYRLMSELDAAFEDAKKTLDLDPDEGDNWNFLGNVLFDASKYSEAIEIYTRAIELDSQNALYLRNRGNTYYQINEYESALADLNKAIELDDDADKRAIRGNIYQAMGKTDAAKKDYQATGDESYKSYDRRYLRFENKTGEKIKLHLQYYTLSNKGNWRWFPNNPESGENLVFDFDVDEAAYLYHDDFKIRASRVRIWAETEKSNWMQNKDTDLMLVPNGSYMSNSGDFETWTQTFTP